MDRALFPPWTGLGLRRAAGSGGRVFLPEAEGGHWLNAENPDAVVGLLARTLPAATETANPRRNA
ncbi:MAG: hypothetical protein OXU64_01630 [Gemmatimonadota bacterium]|nr:hypothetical protein [Gemmatimonadota bacterium]